MSISNYYLLYFVFVRRFWRVNVWVHLFYVCINYKYCVRTIVYVYRPTKRMLSMNETIVLIEVWIPCISHLFMCLIIWLCMCYGIITDLAVLRNFNIMYSTTNCELIMVIRYIRHFHWLSNCWWIYDKWSLWQRQDMSNWNWSRYGDQLEWRWLLRF